MEDIKNEIVDLVSSKLGKEKTEKMASKNYRVKRII